MQITCLFGTINGKNMKISSLDSKCCENSQTLNFCIWLWLGMKYQFGKTNGQTFILFGNPKLGLQAIETRLKRNGFGLKNLFN